MTLPLEDLVPQLKRSLSTPGGDEFPDALNSEWVGSLADAFMDAKMYGFFDNWRLDNDGEIVEPLSTSGDDLSDIQQRLVVVYASMNVLLTKLANLNTMTKYQAGPALTETQKSSQLLKAVLDARLEDLKNVKNILQTKGAAPMVAFSAINIRDRLLYNGFDTWVN